MGMCEVSGGSIELTPRVTGQQHRSADDEMTIKCAYRRNCRFLDNDNYHDWRGTLHDEGIRLWLEHCQEFLQVRFYFDTGLGTFDTLDGNIPTAWLTRPSAPIIRAEPAPTASKPTPMVTSTGTATMAR